MDLRGNCSERVYSTSRFSGILSTDLLQCLRYFKRLEICCKLNRFFSSFSFFFFFFFFLQNTLCYLKVLSLKQKTSCPFVRNSLSVENQNKNVRSLSMNFLVPYGQERKVRDTKKSCSFAANLLKFFVFSGNFGRRLYSFVIQL